VIHWFENLPVGVGTARPQRERRTGANQLDIRHNLLQHTVTREQPTHAKCESRPVVTPPTDVEYQVKVTDTDGGWHMFKYGSNG
jgi:hypothetical protein